jgi:arsenical pump membrane protein
MLVLRSQITSERAPTATIEPAPLDRHALLPASLALAVLAAAYIAATATQFSTGVVAVAGALVLAAVVGRGSPARLRRLRTDVSWSVILFVASLFVVVRALEDTGVTATLLHAWLGSGSSGTGSTVIAYLGTAAGSNVVNNLPMAVLTLSGLHGLGAGALPALGTALGADIGPNLTPIGSLATLLWLVLLRSRGIVVTARTYIKYGILVGLPGIAAGALGLLVTTR